MAYYNQKLGLSDPSKVSLVVKPEYYSVYTTPHGDATSISYDDWFNGWELNDFNIVYDYPVYGVNFDVLCKESEIRCLKGRFFPR